MNRSLRIMLLLVIAVALLFMIFSSLRYFHMKKDLSDLQSYLTVSRESWEKTAAEKEELQVILKSKKEELKEAELSLSEATERAETLKSEIDILQNDIEKLKEKLK